MTVAPCKDCVDRKVNCHSICDKYKEWKSDVDTVHCIVSSVKIREANATRRRNDAIRKMKKKHNS